MTKVTIHPNEPDLNYLFIDCVEARSLKSCDANGWSDPFCVITLGLDTYIGKTRYIERTLNPRWVQRFQYIGHIDMNHNAYITFEVKDHDTMSKNDSIGLVELALADFANHKWAQKWYRLQPTGKNKTTRGWILLRIHLCERLDDAFDEEFHENAQDNAHDQQHTAVVMNEHRINLATLQEAEENDHLVDEKDQLLRKQKEKKNAKLKPGLFQHKDEDKSDNSVSSLGQNNSTDEDVPVDDDGSL